MLLSFTKCSVKLYMMRETLSLNLRNTHYWYCSCACPLHAIWLCSLELNTIRDAVPDTLHKLFEGMISQSSCHDQNNTLTQREVVSTEHVSHTTTFFPVTTVDYLCPSHTITFWSLRRATLRNVVKRGYDVAAT